MKEQLGQKDDFNLFKSEPKVERSNITAHVAEGNKGWYLCGIKCNII